MINKNFMIYFIMWMKNKSVIHIIKRGFGALFIEIFAKK